MFVIIPPPSPEWQLFVPTFAVRSKLRQPRRLLVTVTVLGVYASASKQMIRSGLPKSDL